MAEKIPFNIEVMKNCDLNEIIFLDTIENLLGDEYKLYKTTDKYAPVDFRVVKNGVFVCYLELKVRTNLLTFDTLMIGSHKLKTVRLKFKKTIFVWCCVKTDMLWFILFKNDLMKTIHNADTYFIPKSKCSTDIDNLKDAIIALNNGVIPMNVIAPSL
jgi:hypothetical protein